MSLDKDDEGMEEMEVQVGGDADAGEEVSYDENEDDGDLRDEAAAKKGEEEERLGADPDAANDDVQRQTEKREARRKKRKNQKEWARRNLLELDFLRRQNEKLEGEVAEIKRGQIKTTTDTRITQADNALDALRGRLDEVDEIIAAAVTASDGSEVMRANKIRDEIRDRIAQISNTKARLAHEAKAVETDSGQRGNVAAPDRKEAERTAAANARVFASRHDWFDGKNEDSQAALRLDGALRAQGYSPDQSSFWVELEKRLSKEIPHRFKKGAESDDDDDDSDDEDDDAPTPVKGDKGKPVINGKAKGGPVIGAIGGGNRPNGNGKTYRISAERKQAMMDAGIWDEIPLRNKMIKRYVEYDKKHGLTK